VEQELLALPEQLVFTCVRVTLSVVYCERICPTSNNTTPFQRPDAVSTLEGSRVSTGILVRRV
jgi:hypothetical protein